MKRRKTFRHRRTGAVLAECDVVAYHEAGHVVVSLATGLPVAGAAIENDNEGDGFTAHGPSTRWLYDLLWQPPRPRRLSARRRAALEASVLVSCAGPAAESLFLGGRASQQWSAEDNDDRTDAVAWAIILGARNPRRYVETKRREAKRLLAARWSEVQAVARVLLRRRRAWVWQRAEGKELRAAVRKVQGR